MEEEPQFLDPHADLAQYANRLPHWRQAGAAIFVTFRLADSLPRQLLDGWREERESWLRCNPDPWSPRQEREYRRRFTAAIETWLDEAHGECLLRTMDCARIVGEALRHFDGVRCVQHAWVIMPNYVHALFSPIGEHELKSLLQSWKGYTARAINRLTLRSGTVWQKDYHDRIVRNLDHSPIARGTFETTL